MPTQATPTTSNATRALPADTSTLSNERTAARQLAEFVRTRRPGARNATVKLYQWAMGDLTLDGTCGPKTRARALALGSLIAAPTRSRADVPTANTERL